MKQSEKALRNELMEKAEEAMDAYTKRTGADRDAIEYIWRSNGVDNLGFLNKAVGVFSTNASIERIKSNLENLGLAYTLPRFAKDSIKDMPISGVGGGRSVTDDPNGERDVDANGYWSNLVKALEE